MTDTANVEKPLGTGGIALRLGGGLFLAIFGAGIGVGVIAAWRDHGEFRSGVVIGLGLALLALMAGSWMVLSVRASLILPRSPRVRRARIALYLSLVVGAIVGAGGHLFENRHGSGGAMGALFEAGPISRAFAIALIAGWAVAMIVSIYWHMALDEIERAEYEFGAVLALYGYVTIAPAWWILWRGGMLPEPDGGVIFLAVCVIWCIGWAWRRWR